jgi:hemoglobin-like flavoprotein
MSDRNHLLRDSFAIAVEREPELTERFYALLDARSPHLSVMFRRDRAEQARMLRVALIAVIDHLDDAPWLADTLGALGARHVGYGVQPAMYNDVGDALVDALAEACGARWTPLHAAAWRAAYRDLAQLMLAGARGAAA